MLASEANKLEFFGKDSMKRRTMQSITTRTFFHKLSGILEFHGFKSRLEEGVFTSLLPFICFSFHVN
jgi:hypothetical protein